MVRQAATRVCASQGGGLGAMTEPLYEHGDFADLIGYRLVATGSATYRYRGDA